MRKLLDRNTTVGFGFGLKTLTPVVVIASSLLPVEGETYSIDFRQERSQGSIPGAEQALATLTDPDVQSIRHGMAVVLQERLQSIKGRQVWRAVAQGQTTAWVYSTRSRAAGVPLVLSMAGLLVPATQTGAVVGARVFAHALVPLIFGWQAVPVNFDGIYALGVGETESGGGGGSDGGSGGEPGSGGSDDPPGGSEEPGSGSSNSDTGGGGSVAEPGSDDTGDPYGEPPGGGGSFGE